MKRTPIIAANWKMNITQSEAISFFDSFIPKISNCSSVDIVIAPPFTSIPASIKLVNQYQATNISISSQNVSNEKSGAFTGEINTDMLKDLLVKYVIIGHSERRSLYKENNDIINKKVKKTINANLIPILCIGENLYERESEKLEEILSSQLKEGLQGVTKEEMNSIIIAYEPVWAIGTGKTATPEQAQETQAFVRSVIEKLFDSTVSNNTRIQYGGSVKPANAKDLIIQPDIDGFLVGGASLKADDFSEIVKAAS